MRSPSSRTSENAIASPFTRAPWSSGAFAIRRVRAAHREDDRSRRARASPRRPRPARATASARRASAGIGDGSGGRATASSSSMRARHAAHAGHAARCCVDARRARPGPSSPRWYRSSRSHEIGSPVHRGAHRVTSRGRGPGEPPHDLAHPIEPLAHRLATQAEQRRDLLLRHVVEVAVRQHFGLRVVELADELREQIEADDLGRRTSCAPAGRGSRRSSRAGARGSTRRAGA